MSGLADRLAEAAWEQMKDSPYSNWAYEQLPPKAKARVDRTVAAVLREVARGVFLLRDRSDPFVTAAEINETLTDLAGVVERGE